MRSSELASIHRRLARVEGQVRGLRRMLDEGAYCCDVLNQLAAARAALARTASLIASAHIRDCVVQATPGTAHDRARRMSRPELLDEMEEVLGKLVM